MTQKPKYNLGDKVLIREEIRKLLYKGPPCLLEGCVHEITGIHTAGSTTGCYYFLDNNLSESWHTLQLAPVARQAVDWVHEEVVKQEQERYEATIERVEANKELLLDAIRKESV